MAVEFSPTGGTNSPLVPKLSQGRWPRIFPPAGRGSVRCRVGVGQLLRSLSGDARSRARFASGLPAAHDLVITGTDPSAQPESLTNVPGEASAAGDPRDRRRLPGRWGVSAWTAVIGTILAIIGTVIAYEQAHLADVTNRASQQQAMASSQAADQQSLAMLVGDRWPVEVAGRRAGGSNRADPPRESARRRGRSCLRYRPAWARARNRQL